MSNREDHMSPEPAAARLSPFAVFRNPSFTKMWLAQLISTVGDAFTMIAAGIYIFRLTGSTLQVGLMLMATSVPTMLIGMIAGVFVDRYDRKRIMIAADLLRAGLVFLIPILIPYNIAWLYVLVMLISSIGTFFHPAFESVMPEMATDEALTAANSMIAISSFGSTAIGFAASGLIAAYSIEWAFYIDSVTFVASALLLLGIKVAAMEPTEKTNVAAVVRNLREGVQYLFSSQLLRSLLIVGIIYSLFVGLANTLLLPFATEVLGATEFEYGIQEGLTSVGFVVGSLLVARYAGRLREGQWIIISLIGSAIVNGLYALSSTLAPAIVFITISGVLNAPWSVARRTLIQRNTERQVRGRVFGALLTIGHVFLLLGMGAAGLADVVGARAMFLAAAGIILVAGFAALLSPGIGRPAAEWLRAVNALRKAEAAPGLTTGRQATLADFDRLAGRLPAVAYLSEEDRRRLLKEVRYFEAPEGTCVVRRHETSDAAYFILDGGAVAGRIEDGRERVLEVLQAGDFFGEIAALTGIPRTANVITDQPAQLLKVPAAALRQMSSNPEINRAFMTKMTERMVRMNMIELPKMLTLDQEMLRELRTPDPIAA